MAAYYALPKLYPSSSVIIQSSNENSLLLLHPVPSPPNHQQRKQRRHHHHHLLLLDHSTAAVAPSPKQKQEQKQLHEQRRRDDFYVNLGQAVRTLREDLPLLFTTNHHHLLNYHIYREDITFVDPLNTFFTGIENYKLIFWALRFHGRVLFRHISLEVLRIWQPSHNLILIRWNLRGVPRLPSWCRITASAGGEFQGTSRYKLDNNAKIYEHKVDNLAFNFPLLLKPPPPSSPVLLDLVAPSPTSPNPSTFHWAPTSLDLHSSSS